ncbi:hypothetical protein WJX74_001412 [Apatococcus lobatus]|uniref:Uncharacterized protein n=1 Tax=Apatococcus lobatus TaxID=904363 RepID=A0AAW1QUS1_9CHLO
MNEDKEEDFDKAAKSPRNVNLSEAELQHIKSAVVGQPVYQQWLSAEQLKEGSSIPSLQSVIQQTGELGINLIQDTSASKAAFHIVGVISQDMLGTIWMRSWRILRLAITPSSNRLTIWISWSGGGLTFKPVVAC